MDDFVFGTLTTEESRLAHTRARLSGLTHVQQRHPRDPLPGQAVRIDVTLGPAQTQDRAWVYWTNDGSDPVGAGGRASNGQATPLRLVGTEWNTLLWGYVRRFQGEIPGQPAGTVVRYRVGAGGAAGKAEALADEGAYYAYYVDDDPPPAWAQDAILYHIFVDRFYSPAADFPRIAPKPDLHGNGSLAGITAKLDYIAGLGVNCLWLSPIFPSPSYHGYDATDFFSIHPRLGTLQDFGGLVDQAHARGLRVLLDFVPNHWSNEHPTFVAALTNHDSPYRPWYTFDADGYKSFFGVKTLPQINLRYGPARQHVLDAARYWLDFGVDGYRVDYCIGPTPDFYADFRRVTRAAKPDCWTFGEAIDPPDSQITFEGGMDGALDFFLLEALRQIFAYDQWDVRRFAEFLDRHEAFFPATFSRPSFLDNHDMNRFLWVAQGDQRRLKLAALCQFTLAGPPILYYGTEAGHTQVRDVRQDGWAIHEETRLPMIWGEQQDAELLTYYRALIAARNQHPALRTGVRETVHADAGVLAYRRAGEGISLLTVLNLNPEPVSVTLPASERAVVVATEADGRAEAAGQRVRVSLPGRAGMLLR